MRKKPFRLLLSLQFSFFLLLGVNTKAQVYNGTLTITTQAQVDAFNYTEVTGIIFINSLGNSVTNLDGLSELKTVGGSLFIGHNHITNVNGLANLESVGGVLSFNTCFDLLNLDGLVKLTSVGGLRIEKCGDLTNINSLSKLTGTFGEVHIEDNELLSDISGLSNFISIHGDLTLNELPLLTNVDALSKLKFVTGNLEIRSCPITNVNGLSNLEGVGGLGLVFTRLINLNGLSKLSDIDGLGIASNSLLENIDGLSAITKISGHTIFQNNSRLANLDGLSNLTTIEGALTIMDNRLLANLDGLENLTTVEDNLVITGNKPALTDFCGLYKLFHEGTIGGSVNISNNGANTVIVSPADVTKDADLDVCYKTIAPELIKPIIVGCLEPVTVSHTDYPSGNIYLVGTTQITWTATDGAGNSSTYLQTITIVDNQAPQVTAKPADVTVKCASDVPAQSLAGVTATDNCSVTTINISDAITNQSCANRYTLTRTFQAVDPAGNTSSASQIITVYDDQPPTLTDPTPTQRILWPPNHTMREITINYVAEDNCAEDVHPVITITSNEPVNGVADGDTDPDWEIIDAHTIRLRAERAANGTGRIYTITVTIDDGCNPKVSKTTTVECVHNITGPHSGQAFKVGSIVSFSGEFWDKPGNKHTSTWSIDDNLAVKGSVTEPAGSKNGKSTGSYKFTNPGVYKLQMNIKDQNGVTTYANTNGDLEAIVVIYDPNGGNIYGGGYFNSSYGALPSNPSATGKASYGFAMNYFKNSTYPKGETQFEFKVGDFEFNALNFDYLVINSSMSQFKGTGKIIGGQSGVGFTMTVVDGQLDGSGVDKIRMKIYNKNNGLTIYDNQSGASDAALPTQGVGTNSMIVINGSASITQSNNTQKTEIETTAKAPVGLDVIAYPNPSAKDFSINVQADTKEKIMMQIIDMYGRIIETRNVTANSVIKFGDHYRPGTYFVRVMNGKEHKELKLVKVN